MALYVYFLVMLTTVRPFFNRSLPTPVLTTSRFHLATWDFRILRRLELTVHKMASLLNTALEVTMLYPILAKSIVSKIKKHVSYSNCMKVTASFSVGVDGFEEQKFTICKMIQKRLKKETGLEETHQRTTSESNKALTNHSGMDHIDGEEEIGNDDDAGMNPLTIDLGEDSTDGDSAVPETVQCEQATTDVALKCEECTYTAVSLDAMESHYSQEHAEKAPKQNFQCDKCEYTTDDMGHFAEHCHRHNGEKPFVCTVCNRGFAVAGSLKRHELSHWTQCPDCKVTLTSSGELMSHMKKDHDKDLAYCDLCLQVFSSNQEMEDHNKRLHSFVCTVCDDIFSRATELKRHRVTAHQEDELQCCCCTKKCKSRSLLRKHLLRHDKCERYECEFCGKRFSLESSLYHHRRGMHHAGDMPYKCEMCGKGFNFSHSYRLHKLKHSGARPYKCSVCEKSYLTRSHLNMHFQAVHSGEQRYKCNVCSKVFPYENSLKKHILAIHSGHKPFMCTICSKTFLSRKSLDNHELSHSIEKPSQYYMCDMCNKIFKTEALMRTHKRRHTEAHRFMCDVCGRTFMFKGSMAAHFKTHSDERMYKCTTCGKAFKTQATLYSHQVCHRPDNPYKCSCGKEFKSKERLQAHAKRHSGLKPWKCAVCQRTFPEKGGLTKHMKTVHGNSKRFACPVCGKQSARTDNLRVHMRAHGQTNLEPVVLSDLQEETTTLSKLVTRQKPVDKKTNVQIDRIVSDVIEKLPDMFSKGQMSKANENVPPATPSVLSDLSGKAQKGTNTQDSSTAKPKLYLVKWSQSSEQNQSLQTNQTFPKETPSALAPCSRMPNTSLPSALSFLHPIQSLTPTHNSRSSRSVPSVPVSVSPTQLQSKVDHAYTSYVPDVSKHQSVIDHPYTRQYESPYIQYNRTDHPYAENPELNMCINNEAVPLHQTQQMAHRVGQGQAPHMQRHQTGDFLTAANNVLYRQYNYQYGGQTHVNYSS